MNIYIHSYGNPNSPSSPDISHEYLYTHSYDNPLLTLLLTLLGVILYELLMGFPPFASYDDLTTFQKICNWEESLIFLPEDEERLSPEVKNSSGYIYILYSHSYDNPLITL